MIGQLNYVSSIFSIHGEYTIYDNTPPIILPYSQSVNILDVILKL